jgi:hypothetical protein
VARETAPETGTPHLQGYFQFEKRKRLTTIKNLFKDTSLDGAHWEKARGTPSQNKQYCSKEDEDPFIVGTIQEDGQGRRTDLSDLRDLALSGASDLEMAAAFPRAHAQFNKWTSMLRAQKRMQDQQERVKEKVKDLVLRTWQQQVMRKLQGQGPRKVLWVWEGIGGVGKSTLARHIVITEEAYFMSGGKHGDILYAYCQAGLPSTVVIDLSRDQEDKAPYAVMEKLKDGMFMSPKYQSKMVICNSVKMIVFANFPPDKSKMSQDRWEVIEIINNENLRIQPN